MQMREERKERWVARSVVFPEDYVAAAGWWLNHGRAIHELYKGHKYNYKGTVYNTRVLCV